VHKWKAAAALTLLGLLAAACSNQPSAAPDKDVSAALQARQQELSAEALETLQRRTCADLPTATTFPELPTEALDCLGTGPARPVSSGDGRPTVVNLWASWCAPCVREMPLLQSVADRAGEDVRFVGVDIEDENDSAAALLEATGVRYDQYSDPTGSVRRAVRAFGLPVTLVFDAQGHEVARRLGEVEAGWLEDSLRQAGATVAPASPSPAG
jgi:cytochrome c biogenesis protein CcmG/thiol:disulfide interchange protein DsbE